MTTLKIIQIVYLLTGMVVAIVSSRIMAKEDPTIRNNMFIILFMLFMALQWPVLLLWLAYEIIKEKLNKPKSPKNWWLNN